MNEWSVSTINPEIDSLSEVPRPSRRSDLFRAAFTTRPFQDRVTAMLRRVQQQHAESGFVVATTDTKILFTPMTWSSGLDAATHPMTGNIPTTYFDYSSLVPDDADVFMDNEILPQIIALIHAHTPYSSLLGFSQEDIESHEETVNGSAPLPIHPNLLEGVLLTKRPRGSQTVENHFLAFQGAPTNHDYQLYNFNRLTAQQQVDRLQNSGFQVHLFPLRQSHAAGRPVALKEFRRQYRNA